MNSWCDFILSIFGCQNYKQLYKDTLSSLEVCVDDRLACLKQKHKLEQENEQLKLLIPRPTPPKIDYVIEKDSYWIQNCLDNLGAEVTRLPLDQKYRLTNQNNFLNIVAWDWIDNWDYQSEFFDCENFAISFKAHIDRYFGLNQVGLVIDYRAGHAYNLVIFPDGKVMLFEPQSDRLFFWTKNNLLYVLKDAIVLV